MKQPLSPEQLEKRNKLNLKILRFGCLPIIGIVLLIIIISNFSGSSSSNSTKEEQAFNVPALIGLNIDSARKLLGNSITSVETIEPSKKELKSGIQEWTNYFDKNGYELEVRFNPQTRNIKNLFMTARDTSNHDIDYEKILKICNLQEDNNNYTVEKSILNDGVLSGIIITRKYEDHSNGAYQQAIVLAKNKLNFPDEAKFDWTPSYDKNEGENNYRIVGQVEAKNGFGVMQKQTFKCIIHYNGGDDLDETSWSTIEEISFEKNTNR